jgi:hypothetical protein
MFLAGPRQRFLCQSPTSKPQSILHTRETELIMSEVPSAFCSPPMFYDSIELYYASALVL